MNKTVAVIGGGPSGTAAARNLKQRGYEVIIIDRDSRLGGRICSIKLGEQSFELGAGFVTTGLYPNTLRFLEASNLKGDLNYRKSNAAVVRNGKPHNAKSLIGGSWLPFGAKLIVVKQVLKVIPSWRSLNIKHLEDAEKFDTQSVRDELGSNAGKTLLEYLLQPVLNGYLYWRPEQTSQAILMILTKTSFRKGRTYTLKHGLQQLPESLAKDCTVMLNTEVKSIKYNKTGQYELMLNKGQTMFVDGVVCATTASVALSIVGDLSVEQKAFLSGVAYSKTVVVANAFKLSNDLPNCELAYPRLEAKPIAAITMQSIPDGNSGYERIAKVFASGEDAERLLAVSDDEVRKQLAVTDLALLHVGSETPHRYFIKRWYEALPIFNVGYLKRLKAFKDYEKQANTRIVFAGDYIGGPYT
jgi:oxygen-dependent protoporphyrinogen oxidase